MTDKVIVLVTSGDALESEKIARSLVDKRLAACVNLFPRIRSFYRWEGEIKEDSEFLLMIKTSRALFEQVRVEVESLHSYHVPEVICVPIVDGAENYMTWFTESLSVPKTE